MKTVNLKFVGVNSKFVPNIYVDNKYVKCKINEFGSYEVNIQTEKDEIEIAFTRELELKSKLWWLYALISFIVSIFGIFEPPYDRKCISINCLFKIKLKEENNIKIKFNTMTTTGRAVEIETENNFEEIKNEYNIDKIAKRRWIILLVVKLVCWIALAILIGYEISRFIK